jgi:hypothetical protein
MLETCLKCGSRSMGLVATSKAKLWKTKVWLDRRNPECSGSEMHGRTGDMGDEASISLSLFLVLYTSCKLHIHHK